MNILNKSLTELKISTCKGSAILSFINGASKVKMQHWGNYFQLAHQARSAFMLCSVMTPDGVF
jgi:hypothetical protein